MCSDFCQMLSVCYSQTSLSFPLPFLSLDMLGLCCIVLILDGTVNYESLFSSWYLYLSFFFAGLSEYADTST